MLLVMSGEGWETTIIGTVVHAYVTTVGADEGCVGGGGGGVVNWEGRGYATDGRDGLGRYL